MVAAAGHWAAGCKKTEVDRQAEKIQVQSNQSAENLKSRADEVERGGREAARQQAEQIRAEADRTREEGKAKAEDIRNEGHNRAGTNDYNGYPGPARGGGPSVQSALQSYAEARCNREAHCNNIGVGKRYRNVQTCISDQINDRSQSWEGSTQCRSHGINQEHLRECLSAVRTQDCGNPIDDISRLTQCRVGEICGQ